MAVSKGKKTINLGGTIATIEFEDTSSTVYRRLMLKRDTYIRAMHKKLKDPFAICVSFFIAKKVFSKFEDRLQFNSFMMLGFMNSYEYVERDKVRRYFIDMGFREVASLHNFKTLETLGYINRLSSRPLIYNVTADGRSYFKSKIGLFKELMTIFLKHKTFYVPNNIDHRLRKVKREGKLPVNKYTEEKKQEFREYYIAMMKPFWDLGRKKIPKSLNERHEILTAYIAAKKEAGEEISPVTYKNLQMWTPKNIINKKLTKDKEKAPDTEASSFPSWMKDID